MTLETAQTLIGELDHLLDKEKRALIKGDLEAIGRMLEQKQALIDKINALGTLEQDQFSQVHDRVTRNQALLNSAMEGIRAVSDRMVELRRVRQGLDTYDRTGRKTRFATASQPGFEKRA